MTRMPVAVLLIGSTLSARFWGGRGRPHQDILSERQPPGTVRYAEVVYQTLGGGQSMTLLSESGGPGYLAVMPQGLIVTSDPGPYFVSVSKRRLPANPNSG